MREYITLKTIRLSGGAVGLNDKQAGVRKQALSRIRKDVYEITGPVEFKRGERVFLDAVPKGLEGALDEIVKDKGGPDA